MSVNRPSLGRFIKYMGEAYWQWSRIPPVLGGSMVTEGLLSWGSMLAVAPESHLLPPPVFGGSMLAMILNSAGTSEPVLHSGQVSKSRPYRAKHDGSCC